MNQIYVSNRKKVLPTGIFCILIFTIGLIVLIYFVKVASYSISSYIMAVGGIVLFNIWTYQQLVLKFQTSDDGLSLTYSKKWRTIKWKSIQRIEYKKGFFGDEWMIIHLQSENDALIGVRTNQYIKLWKEIDFYVRKYNPTVILDESFINRIAQLN